MTASKSGRSRLLSPILSAATWSAALLIAASIGGLWFLLAEHSPWTFLLLAAPLALVAVGGILRQHWRARVRGRLQHALDTYAEREIAWARHRGAAGVFGETDRP